MVYDLVTHPRDVAPGYFRIGVTEFLAKIFGSLANDLDIADECVLEHRIVEVLFVTHAGYVSFDLFTAFFDVVKVELIVPGFHREFSSPA